MVGLVNTQYSVFARDYEYHEYRSNLSPHRLFSLLFMEMSGFLNVLLDFIENFNVLLFVEVWAAKYKGSAGNGDV